MSKKVKITNLRNKRRFLFLKQKIKNIGQKNKRFVFFFSGCFFLALFATICYLLFWGSGFFFVNSVNIYGNVKFDVQKIEDVIDDLYGKHIFFINSFDVANTIKKALGRYNEVYLYKNFPNRIEIEIVEKYPASLIVTYKEVVLVDTEGKRVGNLEIYPLELTETEQSLLFAPNPLELSIVKETYLSQLEDVESRRSVNWGEVTEETKSEIYKKLRSEVDSKISEFKDRVLSEITNSIYRDSEVMYFFDKKDLDVILNKEFLLMSLGLSDFLKDRGLFYSEINWGGNYSITFVLTTGQKLIFTERRSFQDQIRDLKTALAYNLLEGSLEIDFRTKNFAVKR